MLSAICKPASARQVGSDAVPGNDPHDLGRWEAQHTVENVQVAYALPGEQRIGMHQIIALLQCHTHGLPNSSSAPLFWSHQSSLVGQMHSDKLHTLAA